MFAHASKERKALPLTSNLGCQISCLHVHVLCRFFHQTLTFLAVHINSMSEPWREMCSWFFFSLSLFWTNTTPTSLLKPFTHGCASPAPNTAALLPVMCNDRSAASYRQRTVPRLQRWSHYSESKKDRGRGREGKTYESDFCFWHRLRKTGKDFKTFKGCEHTLGVAKQWKAIKRLSFLVLSPCHTTSHTFLYWSGRRIHKHQSLGAKQNCQSTSMGLCNDDDAGFQMSVSLYGSADVSHSNQVDFIILAKDPKWKSLHTQTHTLCKSHPV